MRDVPLALYRSPPQGRAGLAVTGFGKQHVTARIADRRLPTHAVVFVEKGRGLLNTAKGGPQEVVGPCLFWLLAEEPHGYGPLPGESWEERWALFTGTFVSDLVRMRLITENAPLVPLGNPRRMQQLFATLHSEFAEDSPLGLAAAAATLHQIVLEAARQAVSPAAAPPDPAIEDAIERLQRRAFEPVDMNAFARELGVSPATLRRRFTASTGLPPKAFQLRLRIDHAKQLLTTTDLSIEAISTAIGIDDAFYFSRLFQDREHCSPSEFRRRHRRQ
ncbi:AraC family transcriptional regulator [Rhizobium grahamii]|uniref:AraC family transcriptional regulator n=1 Tax=Rhizobium grahamii TaxID=1120045 RepID=A0A5Q0CCG1_9HYPH|nr:MULTISPECIES: AraC family transcriptional regulator [Rhizobium]QFY61429.1 AraC family transcriptional regulator [Rhizobium grahamii]QRM49419.1 AraC family transcriptional regulator [Rhizobium sp. BG6]